MRSSTLEFGKEKRHNLQETQRVPSVAVINIGKVASLFLGCYYNDGLE